MGADRKYRLWVANSQSLRADGKQDTRKIVLSLTVTATQAADVYSTSAYPDDEDKTTFDSVVQWIDRHILYLHVFAPWKNRSYHPTVVTMWFSLKSADFFTLFFFWSLVVTEIYLCITDP